MTIFNYCSIIGGPSELSLLFFVLSLNASPKLVAINGKGPTATVVPVHLSTGM